MTLNSTIALIGAGQVGSAAAYALILASVAEELLLVDINPDLRESQVYDLSDVAYNSNSRTRVRAASYREASQCDIVVITAGSRITVGQTSLDYTYGNISIVRTVIDAMRPFRSDTILLVVSNPVDLITSVVQKLSGLPKSQVLGSGTLIDSMRLRGLIADRAAIDPSSIDLSVLGVRGESEVVAWSTAAVNGTPIDIALPSGTLADSSKLTNECKYRSEKVIRSKGGNPFGIGSVVSSICSSILSDDRSVRPVSHFQAEFDCSFSMPAVIGKKGVISTIQISLNTIEKADIAKSAKTLTETLEKISLD